MRRALLVAAAAMLAGCFEPTPAYGPGASSGGAGGSVHVRGYTRGNGTYVAPYTRAAPGHGGGRR